MPYVNDIKAFSNMGSFNVFYYNSRHYPGFVLSKKRLGCARRQRGMVWIIAHQNKG